MVTSHKFRKGIENDSVSSTEFTVEITIWYEKYSLIQIPNCWKVVVMDDNKNSLIPTVHKILWKGWSKNGEENSKLNSDPEHRVHCFQ